MPGHEAAGAIEPVARGQRGFIAAASSNLLWTPEKSVYGVSKLSIECADRCQGHVDQTVSAECFHQLCKATCTVNVHDHIQACFTGDANDLTGLWNTPETMIGLNNNAGYSGTH